jgi:hypothetical protein
LSYKQATLDILDLVVELDRNRILSLAERILKYGIRDSLRAAHSKLIAGQVEPKSRANPGLRLWLERCPFTDASPQIQTGAWSPKTVASLIDWASQARWSYSEELQYLLEPGDAQKPSWLDNLYKVARYQSAIKSMVKLAMKQPEVFTGIDIQEVEAPGLQRFSLHEEKAPLLEAIRNLVGEDSIMIMKQLQKRLGKQDIEAHLRKRCRLDLTLHAEMQIVVFYEGNPNLAPRMPFIGTSKKACFLCHEYLLQHPLKLRPSACHQKIYPSWMPPPYYPIPGKFKNSPFVKLSKRIELLTKRELKTALTVPQRPRNQDSTAGPSLTITSTVPTGIGSQ